MTAAGSENSPSGLSQKSPKAPGSLRHHAAGGFAWVMGQAVGSKGFTLISQTVLALLLSKDDFGLIALTYSAAAFVSIAQTSGLREVLVQRHARIERWFNPAFWMAVSLGSAAGLLMLAMGPVVAFIFHDRRLMGLLAVIAMAVPIETVSVIPFARLQSRLRFRFLAINGVSISALNAALSIIFAWWGFGVYSFVLPRPIVAVLQSIIMWHASDLTPHARAQLRRWRYIYGDSALLLATGFCNVLLSQGDYVTLGLTHSKAELGVYFFAFMLSSQTLQLVTGNLTGVLFPTFSQLGSDRKRQTIGCIRTCRILASVGVPLCFLQMALAPSIIRLLYRGAWADAVPVFQILSIGMAMIIANAAAVSLLQAQRRFSFYLGWTAATAVIFLSAALIGAFAGGARSVAIAVSVFNCAVGPACIYAAIRPGGGTMWDVAGIFARPLAFAIVSTIPAILAGNLLHVHPMVVALVVTGVGSSIYLACMAVFARSDLSEISALVTSTAKRIFPQNRVSLET